MDELIPIVSNGHKNAVDARTLHEFLEVDSKFNDWIKRRISKFDFIEGEDYTVLKKEELDFSGVTKCDYFITLDMAKELAMVENNEKGKQARKYFIEVEKRAVELQSKLKELSPAEMTLMVITNLQQQVAEQKAIAEEAIRTKAMISDRKVATALNTASQAVKRVNKLEIELDRSQEYATIKRMEILNKGFKFNWRALKDESIKQNIAIIKVFDTNYGEVSSYHRDVWDVVYPNFF